MDPNRLHKIPSQCQAPPEQKESHDAPFQKPHYLLKLSNIFTDVTKKEIFQTQTTQTSLSISAERHVFFLRLQPPFHLENCPRWMESAQFLSKLHKINLTQLWHKGFPSVKYPLHFYHLQIIRFLHINNTACK